MRNRLIVLAFIAMLAALRVAAAETGEIKLDVMGEASAGAKTPADVFDASGKKVGQVAPGQSVALAPGTYKLVLPVIGGKVTKDEIRVEAGRTHTVKVTNVAIIKVSVKDRTGKDPGFGVTVTDTNPPHQKLAEFLSGDVMLIEPNQVDVKVDAPPQGYYWHAVELPPGRRAELTLGEVVPAELLVQPVLGTTPLDNQTRVVVYRAGTQKQVSSSEPGPEHRFRLDPGDYDVYVENRSGQGKPYTMDRGIHLESGQKTARKVALDAQAKAGS